MVNEARIMEGFSRRLNAKMEKEGMSAQAVAYYCGIYRTTMSHYRNGTQLPKLWYLVLIAECLNCRVNDLLGYRGSADIVHEDATVKFKDEKEFAEFVRDRMLARMEAKNMTPETLADRINVDVHNITKWFSKWPSIPRTISIIEVAGALECTPSDLLGY